MRIRESRLRRIIREEARKMQRGGGRRQRGRRRISEANLTGRAVDELERFLEDMGYTSKYIEEVLDMIEDGEYDASYLDRQIDRAADYGPMEILNNMREFKNRLPDLAAKVARENGIPEKF